MILPAFVAQQAMLKELRASGDYTGLNQDEAIRARKDIEDLIHLEEYYEIERQTVESR